jgi:hypothetical protein
MHKLKEEFNVCQVEITKLETMHNFYVKRYWNFDLKINTEIYLVIYSKNINYI